MSSESLFLLRPGCADDRAFVVDSWLLGHGNSVTGRDAGPMMLHEHRALARAILARPTTVLTVAHVPDAQNAILGWACTCPAKSIVFFVHVKRDARRTGIMRALLGDLAKPGAKVIYTHRPVTKGLIVPKSWMFNPYENYRSQ